MGTISQIIQVGSNIAIIVGVVIALNQLKLSRKIAEKDLERRKKEATISFTHDIITQSNEMKKIITQAFEEDTINILDERYVNNREVQNCVTRYLNLMERLSVGINTGVYDFYIFNRICGTQTLRTWNQLKNVVEERRRKYGQHAYIDFESVALKIAEIKNEQNSSKNNSGKIDPL